MGSEGSGLKPFMCSTIDPALLRTEWERWKRAFNIYASANDITDQEKLKNKLLHLGGLELQDVFFGIPGADVKPNDENNINVFDVAIEKLDDQFSPKRNSVFERHLFRTMKPEEGEIFERFLIRLRKQSDKCCFGESAAESKEINIKDKIIDVAPPELKKKLLEKEMSLEEMIAVCNIHTQINSQMETMSHETKSISVQRVIGNNQDKKKVKCYKCNRFGHMAFECSQIAPKFNKFLNNRPKCEKCGKLGHTTSLCWTNKRSWNESTDKSSLKRFKSSYVRQVDKTEESGNFNEHFVLNIGEDDEMIDCNVAGMKVRMLIDSGSKNNMIDELTWCQLQYDGNNLMNIRSSTNKSFKAFATQEPLKVKAIFDADISINSTGKITRTIATFYVIEKAETSLLGKQTAMELGVLTLGIKALTSTICEIKCKREPFPKIKDVLVEISIDPNVKPVIQPLRRAPIPLQEKINDKIQELLNLEIIEPVKGPVTWQSPLVPILKENGDLRLCIDMRRANCAILRENHPLPRFEDFLPMIRNAKLFSRLDVKNAFHQLELKESSRFITTFISPKGVFRYTRLMFGVNCAPEIFQKVMERILLPCKGCFNYIDDIIIFGKNADEHDSNLRHVLSVIKDNNIQLNASKCVFNVSNITFLGHHLSESGVRPSIDKIKDLQNFRAPQTVDELCSFLGLVTYIGRFIPQLGTRTHELRELAKKSNKFEWQPIHEKCFLELKSIIGRIETLGYFDPKDTTQVIADASPWALGAVLVQIKNDQPRIISYASKSLTDTEKRYCQTEKEALALVWSVERFSIYLLGLEFELITDHRPLEAIFLTKSKPCARVERWVLRLQSFRYKVIYKKGKTNIADPLSRLCVITDDAAFDEDCEQYIRAITDAVALDIDEIRKATSEDKELCVLTEAIQLNEWEKVPVDYKVFQQEFSIAGELVLRGTKVVIPQSLQKRILDLAHEGHPGETKMKQRLRNRVWFPKIDKMVQHKIKSCRGCILVSTPSVPEPMNRRTLPNRPWVDIAIDFLGPLPSSDYILIIIDYYSRYQEIEIMQRITAKETIKRLSNIFCRLGFPYTITLDNGKQFISEEFQAYCDMNKIHLNFSAPYWPQENGEVERQNRSLIKRLKISQIYGRDWKTDLLQYLTMYYTTPHTTTGKPPADLMYGRPIRDKMPLLDVESNRFLFHDEVRDRDALEKQKQKVVVDNKRRAKESDLEIGDKVFKKTVFKENKLTPNFDDKEYIITQKSGAKCTIEDNDGRQLIRNSSHLKKVPGEMETIVNESGEVNDTDILVEESCRTTAPKNTTKTTFTPSISIADPSTRAKPKRNYKTPVRFDDYVLFDQNIEKEGDVVESSSSN